MIKIITDANGMQIRYQSPYDVSYWFRSNSGQWSIIDNVDGGTLHREVDEIKVPHYVLKAAADSMGPIEPITIDADQPLRDTFAAHALTGLLSNPPDTVINMKWSDVVNELAFKSYDVADAMMARRNKGDGK